MYHLGNHRFPPRLGARYFLEVRLGEPLVVRQCVRRGIRRGKRLGKGLLEIWIAGIPVMLWSARWLVWVLY